MSCEESLSTCKATTKIKHFVWWFTHRGQEQVKFAFFETLPVGPNLAASYTRRATDCNIGVVAKWLGHHKDYFTVTYVLWMGWL